MSRPPPLETRSLLEDTPPSYHSTDDVSSSPVEDEPPPFPPVHVFSRADLAWMLAGLWAGVLLGAFDGMCPYRLDVTQRPTDIYRNCGRNPFDAHWERV